VSVAAVVAPSTRPHHPRRRTVKNTHRYDYYWRKKYEIIILNAHETFINTTHMKNKSST